MWPYQPWLNGEGPERRVFQLAVSDKLAWCVSDPILPEQQKVLRRNRAGAREAPGGRPPHSRQKINYLDMYFKF